MGLEPDSGFESPGLECQSLPSTVYLVETKDSFLKILLNKDDVLGGTGDTAGKGRQGWVSLQGASLLEVASDGNKCSRPKDQVGGGAALGTVNRKLILERGCLTSPPPVSCGPPALQQPLSSKMGMSLLSKGQQVRVYQQGGEKGDAVQVPSRLSPWSRAWILFE